LNDDEAPPGNGERKKEPPEPDVRLEDLPPSLQEAAGRAGWSTLMPVQARAVPLMIEGKDMLVQARTGSGKTGAFLLPMLERLDSGLDACQALILVPTRELARQVCRDAELLCGETGLRVTAVYGGVGYGPQIKALEQGAHIVVGTPGRVLDHLLRDTFRLDDLGVLVFDEGDRMLSMGFYPDMKALKRHLPGGPLQVAMFSATFPGPVRRTAGEFTTDPAFLTLSTDHVHVKETDHLFYVVPGMEKERALVRIIEFENPPSALIFCNTRARVHFVTTVLRRFGYDADALSSDLSQSERERVLERVRQGTLRFLVATDVAARGIDLPALTHVFLYEPPEELEAYIHRAGRTGRAGEGGVAVSLVNAVERVELERIARHYEIEMEERALPSDEDVAKLVSERLVALLEARLRDRDKLATERARRFIPLARELAEQEDESAVIAMLLDDTYQETVHGKPPAPEETPLRVKERKGGKRRTSGRRESGGGGRRKRKPRKRSR